MGGAGIYILAIPPTPPRGRGNFLSQLKNREEFEGGLPGPEVEISNCCADVNPVTYVAWLKKENKNG